MLRDESKLQIFIGDEEIMAKRKAEEMELLDGIGVEEVEENGLPVEEDSEHEEFIGLEADEEDKGEDE